MLSRFLVAFAVFLSSSQANVTPSVSVKESPAKSATIVIGFLGGFVRHDDRIRREVQLAARLREEYAGQAVVDTFENRNAEKAHQEIVTVLDANHDGILSPEEKQDARIILYGHSWGASEVVNLARRLEKDGIPVLLTIQVDSVKRGRGQNGRNYSGDGVAGGKFLPGGRDAAGRTRNSRGGPLAHQKFWGIHQSHLRPSSGYNCADYPLVQQGYS